MSWQITKSENNSFHAENGKDYVSGIWNYSPDTYSAKMQLGKVLVSVDGYSNIQEAVQAVCEKMTETLNSMLTSVQALRFEMVGRKDGGS